jgi:hypothetical protein
MGNPIFIIGNPRSGTTLLRLMLSSHSEILIAPECGFIQWWYEKYRNWKIQDSKSELKIDEFIRDLSNSKKIETWQLNYVSLKRSILKCRPISYAELCAIVYIEYSKVYQNKKLKYWGDKNNYYLNHLELLYQLYPHSNFIIIIRDGRDVACSYRALNQIVGVEKYKPSVPLEIDKIANEWNDNNLKIVNFFKKYFLARKIFIRYEDLISSSRESLEIICNYLDLDFEEQMINYNNNSKGIKEPIETIAWKGKTLEKIDTNNIGKYKKHMTDNEILEFNSIANDLLKMFDYE